jgi:hypothetical protein
MNKSVTDPKNNFSKENNMKKSMFVFLFSFLAFILTAQTYMWPWAVGAGGTSSEGARSISRDSSGNSYISGFFNGTATFGTTTLTSAGGSDIFIAKINSSGAWQWAIKAGGTGADNCNDISTTSGGTCYITGSFNGTATFGTTSLTSAGSTDIFVAKINSSGAWQWAVRVGGTGADSGNSLDSYTTSYTVVTGSFSGTVSFGSDVLTSAGSTDVFAAIIYNTDGSILDSGQAGGTGADVSNSIDANAAESPDAFYITGSFSGSATFGTTTLTSVGSTDIFIAKFTTAFLWAIGTGGTSADAGYGITVDSSGYSYVTGSFQGTMSMGSQSLTSSGGTDIFVAKVNSSGNPNWGIKSGSTSSDDAGAIALDASGNICVGGFFRSTAAFGSISLTSSGGKDVFVAQISNASGTWKWATKAGGTSDEVGYALICDSSGDTYPVGDFGGTATFGTNTLTSGGGSDIFAAKLTAPLIGTKTIGPSGTYTTFTAAINDLNLKGVGYGGVTYNVSAGTYAENPPEITCSGSSVAPIVFKAADRTNPVLTPTGGDGTFGFKLMGVDYITFNGIDISCTNLNYGYLLTYNGTDNGTASADHNTIKNCSISIPNNAYSGCKGIRCYGTGNTGNSLLTNTLTYVGMSVEGGVLAGEDAHDAVIQGNVLSQISGIGISAAYAINSIISGNTIGFKINASEGCWGIYCIGDEATANIYSNTISGGWCNSTTGVRCMYLTSGVYNVYGNVIANVTASGGWNWGIEVGTASTANIYNNTIHDLDGYYDVTGIRVYGTANRNIYNNKIYHLEHIGTNTGNSVRGIDLLAGSTVNIYNNMICDLRNTVGATVPQVIAILLSGGSTINVNFNTVYLQTFGTNINFSSAALFVSNATTVDLRNNIFVNESTPGASGRSVAFWKTVAGFGNISSATDKNVYWSGASPGTTNPICYNATTTYATLAQYKAAIATKDQNSYTEDVPFMSTVSPYDLHIYSYGPTCVEGHAIPIASVTTDIDGQARHATTPDIGADEGTFNIPLPVTPTNVAMVRNGNGVRITWNAVPSANSYYVYRSTNPFISNWGAAVAHIAGTIYSEATTTAKYFYKVTASIDVTR